ncbi:MAG TPA: type II secretion system F family protein [Micromonosporaceae bacterium]|nr:type II secretion system F family protein [Micromonosporaceae bacterium]
MHTAILIIGLVALVSAAFVGSVAFFGTSAGRTGVLRTLATIDRGYSPTVASPQQRPLRERIGTPLAQRLGNLGNMITPSGSRDRLQRQLNYAGNPVNWPVSRVVAAKGIGPVLGAMLGMLCGLAVGGSRALLLGGLVGAVVGFLGPDFMIYNVGVKRQDEIRRSLPDVLDTLTVSVEAGQGFDAALAQVSRNGRGPLVGEAARVLQEMRIGNSRVEALRAMSSRTTVEELRGFASAVVQASELGVPIGAVLREQAKEMRLRRRQRAEEQAQKVPIKILFPTLFCLFPALFVVIMGPGVLSIMNAF